MRLPEREPPSATGAKRSNSVGEIISSLLLNSTVMCPIALTDGQSKLNGLKDVLEFMRHRVVHAVGATVGPLLGSGILENVPRPLTALKGTQSVLA